MLVRADVRPPLVLRDVDEARRARAGVVGVRRRLGERQPAVEDGRDALGNRRALLAACVCVAGAGSAPWTRAKGNRARGGGAVRVTPWPVSIAGQRTSDVNSSSEASCAARVS